MKKLFLAHIAEDREFASQIKELISEVSLGGLELWYSSDDTERGGMGLGVWLEQVGAQLRAADAILPLLTPRSVNAPWILFESGSALPSNKEVIPVTIGIDSAGGVPYPLAMFQTFALTDTASMHLFLRKLLGHFDMRYSQKMAESVVGPTARRLLEIANSKAESWKNYVEPSNRDLLAEIKGYLDRSLYATHHEGQSIPPSITHYTVQLTLAFEGRDTTQLFLPIRNGESVADKLNGIYSLISDIVPGRAYLERWILRDVHEGVYLVVREVEDRIPASAVFRPGSVWEVCFLNRPYVGTDSTKESEGTAFAPRLDRQSDAEAEFSSAGQSVGRVPWRFEPDSGGGPKTPDVSKPDTKDLLNGLRRNDPNQSKRYRQRTGE
jgi:hypothetical protein